MHWKEAKKINIENTMYILTWFIERWIRASYILFNTCHIVNKVCMLPWDVLGLFLSLGDCFIDVNTNIFFNSLQLCSFESNWKLSNLQLSWFKLLSSAWPIYKYWLEIKCLLFIVAVPKKSIYSLHSINDYSLCVNHAYNTVVNIQAFLHVASICLLLVYHIHVLHNIHSLSITLLSETFITILIISWGLTQYFPCQMNPISKGIKKHNSFPEYLIILNKNILNKTWNWYLGHINLLI